VSTGDGGTGRRDNGRPEFVSFCRPRRVSGWLRFSSGGCVASVPAEGAQSEVGQVAGSAALRTFLAFLAFFFEAVEGGMKEMSDNKGCLGRGGGCSSSS
jgi:hypothetical protein